MTSTSQNYEARLIAAAGKLMQQSKTDGALADRLMKDPAKAVAEAAGHPVPEGIRIIASRGADGKSVTLKPEIDPAFTGELGDKVLEAVAGGGSVDQK